MKCILRNNLQVGSPVCDYIDQCFFINGAEHIDDLLKHDQENIVAGLLDDINFDTYEILMESGYDTINGLKRLFRSEISPHQFKVEMVSGIISGMSNNLNEIFNKRISDLKLFKEEDPFLDFDDLDRILSFGKVA